MPKNWEQRERKQHKAKNGMRINGKSAFVIMDAQEKRDAEFVKKVNKRKGNRNA